MKIIFSPTKKMLQDESVAPNTVPVYLTRTEELLRRLRQMTGQELQTMYRCNDKILLENQRRIERMDLHGNLSPALFSYIGLAFQHLSAASLSQDALSYLQSHFRILSGFYGILKPMDGITPYRLEMQSVLPGGETLYHFWQDALYKQMDDRVIVNLASKEYSRCIGDYLQKEDRMIHIIFGEYCDGKFVTKATKAKMARGDMVWYMAENQIENPEDIKHFSDHYDYEESLSDDRHYVFVYQG